MIFAILSNKILLHMMYQQYPQTQGKFYKRYIRYKSKYLCQKNSIRNQNLINAMILPHADTYYVKYTMNYMFEQIDQKQKYDLVILLTTNHNKNINQIGNYSLEKYNINYPNVEYKAEHFGISYQNSQGREVSHVSVIPYIKKLNCEYHVLSIGNYDEHDDSLVNFIYHMINTSNKKILLIGNTDLLHCGPQYQSLCPNEIKNYNINIIHHIIKTVDERSNLTSISDPNNHIISDPNNHMQNICGPYAIKTFIAIINKLKLNVIQYTYSSSDKIAPKNENENENKNTSNFINNNFTNSVGYTGILFSSERSINSFLYDGHYLSKIPKIVLENINFDDKHQSTKDIDFNDEISKFRINQPLDIYIINIDKIFITIKKNDKLRGCIGISVHDDIIDTIIEDTIDTSKDSRFDFIEKDELKYLSYKVNFLKKPKKIKNNEMIEDKIIVGLHGVTIKFKDSLQSVTFLASVLPELGITQENIKNTFGYVIEHLAYKAGLKVSDFTSVSEFAIKQIEWQEIYECTEISDCT